MVRAGPADLAGVWGPQVVRISHIGSTAAPGLLAKPTVDILLEVAGDVSPQQALERSAATGWTHMSGSSPIGWAVALAV